MIKLSHLKKIGADRISISGGPYQLQARPNPRALRRIVKRHTRNLAEAEKALIEESFLEPDGSAPYEEAQDKLLEVEDALKDKR